MCTPTQGVWQPAGCVSCEPVCVCVSLVRVVIICPASTHTALVSSPSLTVLRLSINQSNGSTNSCGRRGGTACSSLTVTCLVALLLLLLLFCCSCSCIARVELLVRTAMVPFGACLALGRWRGPGGGDHRDAAPSDVVPYTHHSAGCGVAASSQLGLRVSCVFNYLLVSVSLCLWVALSSACRHLLSRVRTPTLGSAGVHITHLASGIDV